MTPVAHVAHSEGCGLPGSALTVEVCEHLERASRELT